MTPHPPEGEPLHTECLIQKITQKGQFTSKIKNG